MKGFWLFGLFILLVGCSSPKEKEAPEIRKEATLAKRLAKIPNYERANYETDRGIEMVKQANQSLSNLDRNKYFKEAMVFFWKAIHFLEEAQRHLDEADQKILEKQILLVHGYLKTCLRDRPQMLQKEKDRPK